MTPEDFRNELCMRCAHAKFVPTDEGLEGTETIYDVRCDRLRKEIFIGEEHVFCTDFENNKEDWSDDERDDEYGEGRDGGFPEDDD